MFRPSWSGWRATRQAYGEHRPFARFARHGHVAAHHAGELAREGKAEPRSAVAPRGQGIGLGEFLKKFRLLFGGQADAGIRDGKLDPVTSVRGGASGNRTEPAGRKVLRHQLHNLLPQANGVALALLRDLDHEFGDRRHGGIIAIHKPQLLKSAFQRGSDGFNILKAKKSPLPPPKRTKKHANKPPTP